MEIEGPEGDISLACDCVPRHLKSCPQVDSCKCRWARRHHTEECHEEYMEVLRTPEITREMLDTISEDEDEAPLDGLSAAPGKRKAHQEKDRKEAK